MGLLEHRADYPTDRAAAGIYRIEECPDGGYDVWIDPPDELLGWPLGDTMPEQEN